MVYRVSKEDAERYRASGFWSGKTLFEFFEDCVSREPERLALADMPGKEEWTGLPERRPTFRTFSHVTANLAKQLEDAGLKPGDCVAVQMANTAELAATYLACWQAGLIISPAPVQWREYELKGILDFIGAKALITQSRVGDADHSALALSVVKTAQVFVWGKAPTGTRELRWDETKATPFKVDQEPTDIATICWTSGTESRPKGVPRSHDHWLAAGRTMQEACGLQEGDVILCPFPIVNMAALGGCLVPWLLTGGTLVLHHPLDLPIFLKQLVMEKVNYTVAPPAVLNMLLKDEKLLGMLDLSNFRSIGSGSAPLAPWMVKGFQDRFGLPIVNIFGSNEGTCLSSGTGDVPDPENRARYFPRIGAKELSWPSGISKVTETKLLDLQTGKEVTEPGAPGELVLKGPTVFGGYWRAEEDEALQSTIDEEGFFHTGDVFEIAGEEDRFYLFVERAKDIIIRGGMNISPGEIDGLLAGHPEISEAAVVGVPDERLGELICAAVVPAEGKSPTLESVCAHLKAQGIAVYKLPEKLVYVEALPRNPIGKVLRRILKDQVMDKAA